jgi:transcriptional regulator with XRE-family HTH domain
MTIASALIAYKKQHNLSDREIGEKLGVVASSIWTWRNGMTPTKGHRKALRELLKGETHRDDATVYTDLKPKAIYNDERYGFLHIPGVADNQVDQTLLDLTIAFLHDANTAVANNLAERLEAYRTGK